jgi:two-component system, chemotaxis family, CheB/CheR fusion protein
MAKKKAKKKTARTNTRKAPAAKKASSVKKKVSSAKKAPSTKKAKPKSAAKRTKAPALRKSAKAVSVTPNGCPIVGIGASAGGLDAFQTFFKAMPHDSGMAFVLVAHLDPTHVSILPELLQKRTKMAVHQIIDGMEVHPNAVYVIPPNKDLGILNGILQLMNPAQPRGANLPIDSFFRSLAQDQGANAAGIVLSGTGTDGTLGVKAIKGEVGMVMVQDEESAKYDGMPRSAIATGLADYVLPPEKMPEQLTKYMMHASRTQAPRIVPVQGRISNALQKIFVILRSRTNHDFSLYKKNTICRRIERRMNVHQIDDINDYVSYVQESDREAEILFKELLIGVTSFFRDPEAFDVLKTKALSKLLAGKAQDSTVRVWVPGCSSGEEAYSLAILLHECREKLTHHFNIQIFGTDIDEDAIQYARAGVYPASILADIGAARLKRNFMKQDDGLYQVKKIIREMLVFAPQNIIKDPPFTKLDLLSCRNLLIYLGPELQKRLLPNFHYSLAPGGILMLGSSETIGHDTDLFSPLSTKWKVFRRNDLPNEKRTVDG